MSHSLLAHMYSHIKGSQEDVATYSLEFIVSHSAELNTAFTGMLENSLHGLLGKDIRYSCQSIGKEKERPDISGTNPDGKEVILCEAKFYAGLTSNQPNTYIERLIEKDGVGLVFICPVARKKNLWTKLKELCEKEGRVIESVDDYCVAVDSIRMSIITWDEIIERLRQTASALDKSALSDIDQLEGFCKLMDDNAFIPFSTEDFGPEKARQEERYYQVPDAVVAHLNANKVYEAKLGKLKASPNRNGYIRYIFAMGHALAIIYDRTIWKDPKTVETPFWVSVMEKNFKQTELYKTAFRRYKLTWQAPTATNGIALPLFAPTNAPLDEVAEDLVKQIVDYVKVIDEMLATGELETL